MSLLNDYEIAQILNNGTVIISCVHNLALFCCHLYFMTVYCIQNKANRIHFLSLISIFMWFIFSLSNVGIIFNWNDVYLSCKWTIKCAITLYTFTKTLLYFLFLERLFIIFQGALKFKRIHKLLSRISFAVFLSFIGTLEIIYGDGYFNQYTNSCKALYPFWINGFVAIGDFFICIAISIVFARRLLTLSYPTRNSEDGSIDSRENNGSLNVLKRSTLLTLIALTTTPISLILMSILGLTGMWVTMDSMVNCWCVLLMFTPYKTVYVVLCGKLESYVSIKCLTYYSCSCNCCCPISSDIKPQQTELQNQC